ncbi:MAG: DMT family transporter [Acidimicrobiales bacterium]
MAAILALAAAAVFGAADFTGGSATRRIPILTVTLLTSSVGVVLAGVLVAALGGEWSASAVGWGALGGTCGLVGLSLLYLGLASGPNRLVSPVSAVLAAVIPVAVGIGTGDRPDALGMMGLVLAAPAIWLVAGGDLLPSAGGDLLPSAGGDLQPSAGGERAPIPGRSPLLLAAGAGVGFGLFFTCLAQTPDDAGAIPLLAARVTSTVLLVVAATQRRPARPERRGALLAIAAGTLDMSANGLFLWSTRLGDLAVVGALVSLFPVTTILLAMGILHERLTRSQATGLGLAVVTAALLS